MNISFRGSYLAEDLQSLKRAQNDLEVAFFSTAIIGRYDDKGGFIPSSDMLIAGRTFDEYNNTVKNIILQKEDDDSGIKSVVKTLNEFYDQHKKAASVISSHYIDNESHSENDKQPGFLSRISRLFFRK